MNSVTSQWVMPARARCRSRRFRPHHEPPWYSDGSYGIVADLVEDGKSLVTLHQPIALADGIEARRADVEKRQAKIQGHESAQATIWWPFDMARVVNLGIRELEAGKDPLLRTESDHEWHYRFEEASNLWSGQVRF